VHSVQAGEEGLSGALAFVAAALPLTLPLDGCTGFVRCTLFVSFPVAPLHLAHDPERDSVHILGAAH
jgi:hypothetical protein